MGIRVVINSEWFLRWREVGVVLTSDSMLLTHLYEYFGVLLGCSQVNTTDFPAYEGEASMYELHK